MDMVKDKNIWKILKGLYAIKLASQPMFKSKL